VYWVLCGVCRQSHAAQHAAHTAHIATAQQHNFNDVFLLLISTKTVTLARFHRMLPGDGPSGPKHVEAIKRDILSVSCSILCFNKECIFWQKSFERIVDVSGVTEACISRMGSSLKNLCQQPYAFVCLSVCFRASKI
jgi:hypothetical protein